jgi:uncharacterized protein RhaS with RHS repeats
MTYNPLLGRWMEEDPLGFEAGDANLYRYVSNDPTNLVDPTGLIEWEVKGDGKTLGKLSFETVRAGMQTTFIVNLRNYKSLGDAAAAIKADHFNWYQIVVEDPSPQIPAKIGKRAKLPYTDLPNGGYKKDPKEEGTQDVWADGLPWYRNEGPPPPKNTPGYRPESQLDIADQKKDIIASTNDNPTLLKDGTLVFKTWLVAVDKDGKPVAFLGGATWKYVRKGGKGSIEGIKQIADCPTKDEYNSANANSGFPQRM